MLYDKLMNPKGALAAVMLSMLLTGSLSVEAARKKTVQKIKVACVGNSITYGTGIEDRGHFSYPVQLQKMLGDKYQVGNFGKPGATLLNHGHRPYMKQQEYKQAMAFKGDIAVIHLGINDTDPRNWPNYRDEFVKDYLSLMDSLRSANPKVRFILACMTPIAHRHPRFISGTKQWHDEIQEAIKVVAKVSGAELIDFHAPLYPYPNLLPDAIHPNPEGAGILAKTVYGGITGNYGGLQMSSLYTDHMVLQRNQSLDIHGIANTGDQVTVSIAGQKASAIANNRGEWSVVLQPLPVGTDYTLTIQAGKQKKEYHHVAVGEVWLCSGQSNMAFRLNQASTGKRDIVQANDPDLRLFDMKGRWETYDVAWPASCLDSLNHLQYYRNTTWQGATPETAAQFSAVAYYYGKMLRDSLKVPVGLICNAIGGAPTEAWVDRNTLETRFPAILRNWLQNDFIQNWVRGRAAKNLTNDATRLGRHPYEPCYLYESGILPLQQYPIKGVIWYQGESNAHNMDAHSQLFRLLVDSWRGNWKNPQMPFYFVQLSSLNRPSWTWFRDSQLRLMKSIPNTGMAVSSDYGDSLDVHPTNKQPVGERLGRWALNQTYGHGVTPSGPIYNKVEREGNALVVSFAYSDGLRTSDGNSPRCFEIAGEEGMFYPAQAKIEGDQVRLTSPEVKLPRFVRYGWQPFTRANLVNSDGLPASTFRGDTDSIITIINSCCTMKSDPKKQYSNIKTISGFPAGEAGYDLGVSACYGGFIGDYMVVAGGCNFPEPGKKKYYSGIYAAKVGGNADETPDWQLIGHLPEPAAYGGTVSSGDSLILVGGCNNEQKLRSVLSLHLDRESGKPVLKSLPSLPRSVDNMGVCLSDTRLFVVGGNQDGRPSSAVLSLEIGKDAAWKNVTSKKDAAKKLASAWKHETELIGEPRVQPVCAAYRSELYVWGGFYENGKSSLVATSGLCYHPESKSWTSLPAPRNPEGDELTLTGATAMLAVSPSGNPAIVCAGGVNKEIFWDAISGTYSMVAKEDYLKKDISWYKFNDNLLVYSLNSGKWETPFPESPLLARAGGQVVMRGHTLYYIGGELKPGLRSPGIVKVDLR